MEAVICMFIFLMAFCAITDLLMISVRYSVLTDTAKELARTLSVQGGSLELPPDGYEADAASEGRTYYKYDELGRLVQNNMKRGGFDDCEWSVKIEYTRIYDDSDPSNLHTVRCDPPEVQDFMGYDGSCAFYANRTAKIDYLSNFNVIVTGKYKYRFLSLFIGEQEATLNSIQPGLSEWRYNYNYWPGEL